MALLRSPLFRCLILLAAGTWSATPGFAQRVWNGGGAPDTSWTNAANWGGTAPVAGDSLTFTAATNTSTVNSFASDTTFTSITFDNTSNPGAFALGGNRITLAGNDGTVNLSFTTTGTFDGTGKFTLATYSGLLTGTFANYADDTDYTIGTGSYRFDYNDGGAITLTAVPEPGTIGLQTLGLACLIWRSRRRRDSSNDESRSGSLDFDEKVWQTRVDRGGF